MLTQTTLAWMLITVTSAGQVWHSNPFASSIALTGRTIEQEAARKEVEAWEEARREQVGLDEERAWRTAHPPRKPATDGERANIKIGDNVGYSDSSGASYHTCGGMICDDEPILAPGMWVGVGAWISTQTVSGGNPPEIKSAECVITEQTAGFR